MNTYIQADKLIAEIKRLIKVNKELKSSRFTEGIAAGYGDVLSAITSLQQERPKKRLIQVKCLYPYDESWQQNKVYTCEVWHHGDLNRDFWDVYYDYGKDPKYVQFPTIELLNEEFVIIQEESHAKQEQPKLPTEELDKLAAEEFASHSRTTEYGLEVTYNRAELYQLFKRMAILFNARKEVKP